MKLTIASLLLLSTMSFAQTNPSLPAPASPTQAPDSPALNTSTSVAISTIQSQAKQLEQIAQQFYATIHGIDQDVRRDHPGFHFDEKLLTVVKDDPKPAPASVPAKK